jgi:hypothetical protein
MQDDLEIIEKCLKERGVDVRTSRTPRLTISLEREILRELEQQQIPFEIAVENESVFICSHQTIGLHDPGSLDKIAKIIKHCNGGPDIVGVGKGMTEMSHCAKCKKL